MPCTAGDVRGGCQIFRRQLGSILAPGTSQTTGVFRPSDGKPTLRAESCSTHSQLNRLRAVRSLFHRRAPPQLVEEVQQERDVRWSLLLRHLRRHHGVGLAVRREVEEFPQILLCSPEPRFARRERPAVHREVRRRWSGRTAPVPSLTKPGWSRLHTRPALSLRSRKGPNINLVDPGLVRLICQPASTGRTPSGDSPPRTRADLHPTRTRTGSARSYFLSAVRPPRPPNTGSPMPKRRCEGYRVCVTCVQRHDSSSPSKLARLAVLATCKPKRQSSQRLRAKGSLLTGPAT